MAKVMVMILVLAGIEGIVAGQAPASAGLRTLKGHVPAVVARLQPVGRLEAQKEMKISIGLPLRNQVELTNLLSELYDPASSNYRHFLTPEEFTARFGPTEEDYQTVIAFAKASRLSVTGTHRGRTLVELSGKVADIERAFHVKMQTYQHPKESRKFFSPDVEPTVDAALPILGISGLNNYIVPRPLIHRKTAEEKAKEAAPASGSAPDGSSYLGYDFRAAYVPDVSPSLVGTGQSVGLLEFDSGFLQSDITAYEALAGLPNVLVTGVTIDGYDGGPGIAIDEVSLDIEMAISMAPGLTKVVVYEGSSTDDILTRIAEDGGTVNQIGASWTYGIDSLTDTIFLQFAAQGQSFYNASGDNDAYLPGDVPTPADDPNITVVGGTTLSTTGPKGSWVSEKVWNERTPNPNGGDWGSSGGISTTYPIPSWQQGINMTNNQGSTTFRNLPDVALTADNIWIIVEGESGSSGGTSAATPLWAAFTALVNQQAVQNGKSPVGFVNPALYSIGKGSAYASCFHDITNGDNTWSGSPTKFKAVAGYDLCTGWGTPKGQNLINALVGSPPRTGILQFSVVPPAGANLIASSTQAVYVTVSDVNVVTGALVTATMPGVFTNLVFHDNGQSPDVTANDGIYSAQFQVPSGSGVISMTISATATNELGVTNVISYNVIPTPPNDYFVNATKVPAAGAAYLSNNRFATIETGEPSHAGDANMVASLWWDLAPTANTNYLLNLTGTAIETVMAVYTGPNISNLVQVAAINGTGLSHPPSINFNAVANTTYHIAVAGARSTDLGSIYLAITPGGSPDTNPPTVIVSNPLSGLWVSNRVVVFSGTASDPAPNASGVQQVNLVVNNQWQFTATGTTSWSCPVALVSGLNSVVVAAQDAAGNISSSVTVQISYVPPPNPVNDLFANATVITNNSGVFSVNTTNATAEFGEPAHAGSLATHSVWYSFTPASDGVITLNTTNSQFDTVLALYTGSSVESLTTVASDDDAYPGAPGGFSFISQAIRSNVTYHIALDGYGGASGQASLKYSFSPAALYNLTVSNSSGGFVQISASNSLGGSMVLPGLSADFAAGASVQVTATPLGSSEFDIWTGSVVSLANPLSIIMNAGQSIYGNFISMPVTDGFESGDFSRLPWTTAGDALWFVQTNVVSSGKYAARSGIITNSQSSSLMLTANFRAGNGAFDYLVSSEQDFDFLSFYVDGVLMQQWSGIQSWSTYSFPVPAGTHTLQWTYAKDPSGSAGLDAGFIDNLILPIEVATNSASPAKLQIVRQTYGGLFVDITGQTNQQYVLQTSTNLFNWQNFSTNIFYGGVLRISDPASISNKVEFYRAVVSP